MTFTTPTMPDTLPDARLSMPTRRVDEPAFAQGALVDAGDARRAETEAFIAQVYRARYGAGLASFLPHLLAFRNEAGALRAAVGLRSGDEGSLFVEQYLDVPAEAAIASRLGRPVSRGALVEAGNFGAMRAGDARALIVHMTHWLHLAGFRWVLFAATRQLRNTFDRLHLGTVDLAPALAARLQDDASDWGRYYDTQPRLMFGDIGAGHAWLVRSGALPAMSPCSAWLPRAATVGA
jgi:hypothetical protein